MFEGSLLARSLLAYLLLKLAAGAQFEESYASGHTTQIVAVRLQPPASLSAGRRRNMRLHLVDDYGLDVLAVRARDDDDPGW